MCVHCTVQSQIVIGVCTVHVKREIVIGVCTVHSAERDSFWCVYSAQCRVRLCVQCTVQSEIVIDVCTVQSAE